MSIGLQRDARSCSAFPQYSSGFCLAKPSTVSLILNGDKQTLSLTTRAVFTTVGGHNWTNGEHLDSCHSSFTSGKVYPRYISSLWLALISSPLTHLTLGGLLRNERRDSDHNPGSVRLICVNVKYAEGTIDFDDEEFSSAPTPFGRSAGGAFGFGGFGSSGLDSPTLTTPLADRGERSFFPSHSRVDSVASEDSVNSGTTRYTSKPFAHSSQSSIATTSTAFSKKPSFASIRNAFKKSNDPPPVPSLDHHPYPVLKNPFNRSTSSLSHVSPVTTRSPHTTNIASPPFPRSQTPSSAARPTTKSKHHAPAKSHHSQTGSIFHASDGGSDYGNPYSSSPPPVPRVPNAFGHAHRSETPPTSDFEDDKIVMNPKTPSDYALHAVFMRFATSCENKIEKFLRQGLVCLAFILLVTVVIFHPGPRSSSF